MELKKLQTLQESLEIDPDLDLNAASDLLKKARKEADCLLCKGYLDATRQLIKSNDKETASKVLAKYLEIAPEYDKIYKLKQQKTSQETVETPDRPISTVEKLLFAKVEDSDFLLDPRLERIVVKSLDMPFELFNSLTEQVFNFLEGKAPK